MVFPRTGRQQVNRGDELALNNPVDGLYYEQLLDCSMNDSVIAFALEGTEHPFIGMIPKVNTTLYKQQEAFLQYIAPDGTAAGTPSTAAVSDACAPGNTFENGFVRWEVEGFTRLRRSTPTRDITDKDIKFCDVIPIWDIAGNRITDDFEWDAMRLGNVIMQDFHNAFLLAQDANAGETDGLLANIDFGYVDPTTGNEHPEMDSWVFDWNGNEVCDYENGSAGVTLNGIALSTGVTANMTLISMIRSYARRVSTLIDMSSVSGAYNFLALGEDQLIRAIIDCWVCEVRCGRDVSRMDTMEARASLAELHSRLGSTGAVTLNFDGFNVTFVTWTREGLYDNATGTYSLIALVPRIGNYNAWEMQFKDMQNSVSGLDMNYKEWMVSDGSRFLHWSQIDHTCYQRHVELQYRWAARARWTALKVTNISVVEDAFGRISSDPSSLRFLGRDFDPADLTGDPLDPASTYVPFVLRS